MWDTISASSSNCNPSQEWLRAPKKLELLLCTQQKHKFFANRMFYLRSQLRKRKGGRQKKEFLEKEWRFIIQRDDLVFHAELDKENKKLKEMVCELQQKVADQGSLIKKKITARDKPTEGR